MKQTKAAVINGEYRQWEVECGPRRVRLQSMGHGQPGASRQKRSTLAIVHATRPEEQPSKDVRIRTPRAFYRCPDCLLVSRMTEAKALVVPCCDACMGAREDRLRQTARRLAVSGLSNDEIADRLELKLGAVRRMTKRCRGCASWLPDSQICGDCRASDRLREREREIEKRKAHLARYASRHQQESWQRISYTGSEYMVESGGYKFGPRGDTVVDSRIARLIVESDPYEFVPTYLLTA